MSFNYLQSYVKMPLSDWCYIPISLSQEQAAKTCTVSEVRIQVYSIMYRRKVPNKPPFTRLVIGLLVSNAWIEHKSVQYWWWFLRQWCRDVASGADRHHDIGLQVVEAHLLLLYFLPARASEQGNVIGSVRIYIYICTKKICNWAN